MLGTGVSPSWHQSSIPSLRLSFPTSTVFKYHSHKTVNYKERDGSWIQRIWSCCYQMLYFYSACCKSEHRCLWTRTMFWDENFSKQCSWTRSVSHRTRPIKRRDLGRFQDEHYSGKSRETSPSFFFNERDVLHQRGALHILRLVMTTQTHAVLHPSDFLSLLHCYFQDQTEQCSLCVLHCFSPAVPVVGGHTALRWPSRFYFVMCNYTTLSSPRR